MVFSFSFEQIKPCIGLLIQKCIKFAYQKMYFNPTAVLNIQTAENKKTSTGKMKVFIIWKEKLQSEFGFYFIHKV